MAFDLSDEELQATREMNGADKKIKVKEYVRTKYGIAKIIDIKENPHKEKTIYVLDKNIICVGELDYGAFYILSNPFAKEMINEFDVHFGDEKQILKHSKNIIDLIESGDYVNGHLVFDKILDAIYVEDNQNKMAHIPITNKDIKSILTKEQYEKRCYKVEE